MYKDYYMQARDAAEKIRQKKYQGPVKLKGPDLSAPEGFVPRRSKEQPAAYEPMPQSEVMSNYMAMVQESSTGPRVNLPARSGGAQGYPMKNSDIEALIRREATLRKMDPEVAIQIYRHEGAGAYQSQIAREGSGTHQGKEASFGPFQLFTGGGLGNEYEKETGRNLLNDNTPEGIELQVKFALDKAVEKGWSPWYGRGPAGIGTRDGLSEAVALGNWIVSDV